jgi:hypothetical protein
MWGQRWLVGNGAGLVGEERGSGAAEAVRAHRGRGLGVFIDSNV